MTGSFRNSCDVFFSIGCARSGVIVCTISIKWKAGLRFEPGTYTGKFISGATKAPQGRSKAWVHLFQCFTLRKKRDNEIKTKSVIQTNIALPAASYFRNYNFSTFSIISEKFKTPQKHSFFGAATGINGAAVAFLRVNSKIFNFFPIIYKTRGI